MIESVSAVSVSVSVSVYVVKEGAISNDPRLPSRFRSRLFRIVQTSPRSSPDLFENVQSRQQLLREESVSCAPSISHFPSLLSQSLMGQRLGKKKGGETKRVESECMKRAEEVDIQ